ncbi:MAG: hypothetical protein Q7U26_16250 [Aquabacterium sp.]|nr:hypothetical protein [Aquabacterium sp.]
MLFLWLFGLGASIANACITAGPVEPVVATVSHLVAAVEAHQSVAPHDHGAIEALPAQSAAAAVHQGSFAKANCQDFCEKATVSIPPLKSALDDAQSHVAVTTTAMTALPIPAFAPVRLWVPRRDGVQAPPIHIAFLRLAL